MANIANLVSSDFVVPQSAARRLIVQKLYREYGPRLVHFAVQRVRDEDAAEDIVQDVFTAILSGRFPIPAVDVHRKLVEIVRQQCATHRRSETLTRDSRRTREVPESEGWRAWRQSLARRGDRNDDLDDPEENQ
jgi:DNA-directed RNA polymerase specialized sigma24 family protein